MVQFVPPLFNRSHFVTTSLIQNGRRRENDTNIVAGLPAGGRRVAEQGRGGLGAADVPGMIRRRNAEYVSQAPSGFFSSTFFAIKKNGHPRGSAKRKKQKTKNVILGIRG